MAEHETPDDWLLRALVWEFWYAREHSTLLNLLEFSLQVLVNLLCCVNSYDSILICPLAAEIS
jgi:hypothetical protein